MGTVTSALPETIEPGTFLPLPESEVIDTAQAFTQFLNMDLSRNEALLGLAAVLFFSGVLLSILLRLNGRAHPAHVLISSIVVFLLTSPAWAYTLEGNWRADQTMPLLDDLFQWASGSGAMPQSLFALGLVILMGMMAWPIMHRIIRLARSRVSAEPAAEPT